MGAFGLAVVLTMAAAAPAPQAPDAGLVRRELGVERTDGGFVVAPPPDAGVPEATLVPPRLLADSPAVYPESLRAEPKQGEVKLELLIDDQGQVESATLVEGADPAFNEAALHAASKLQFAPATLNGQPVPVRIAFTYQFTAPTPVEPDRPPTGTLKGLVRSKGNRRPIAGAVLQFRADNLRVETDTKGRFTAEVPAGRRGVQVTAPGFREGYFPEEIRPGEELEVIYGLEPLIVNPYETIVRGDRERTEVSRVTLHEAELREVPGTAGDPFRVVMLLPGVSSIVSGLAYPIVRGSQPAATGYFIDGIRVPLLFHLFLGPSVVHPDFIESIDFYPGVAPPQYGRLMGGVIDGKISRPREGLHATGYADFINAGLFVEYPFEQTGTSVTLAGRVSYTPWLLALAASALPSFGEDQTAVLDFWDYQGRVEQKLLGGSLRLFAFGSSDLVGTRAKNERGTTILPGIRFHRVDLRYKREVGVGELEVGATWGLDQVGFEGSIATQPGQGQAKGTLDVDDRSLKARATWTAQVSPSFKLVVGADFDRREAVITTSFELPQLNLPGLPTGPDVTTTITSSLAMAVFAGGYVQGVWTPHEKWTVIPGVRVDNYHLVPRIDRPVAEPRLTVRYQHLEWLTLKGGAGLYHQPPSMLISLPVVDIGLMRYSLQRGVQLDVGVEWKIREGIELNVDAYVNPLLRTLEVTAFTRGSPPDDATPGSHEFDQFVESNATHGYATGLEVMLRHPLGGNWFGWLSYSLQRSVRWGKFDRLNEFGQVIGEDSDYLAYAFDQTHVMNAVLSYKFPGNWTVGAALHFNTGLPEGGLLGQGTQREGTDPATGLPRWINVQRDQWDRMPPFLRLDVRVAKAWAFETFSMELYFDVLNVLLRQEVVAFNYRGGIGGGGGPLVKEPTAIPIFIPILGLKGEY